MESILPSAFTFVAVFDKRGHSLVDLVKRYARYAGKGVSYLLSGMTKHKPGTIADLERALAATKEADAAIFKDEFGVSTSVLEGDDEWTVEIAMRLDKKTAQPWIRRMVEAASESAGLSGFRGAVVSRHPSSDASFAPEPPIAGANHVVVTTDPEVAAAYDDPSQFWRMWKVEKLGEYKLCTRGLDDIAEDKWLARTFESTMALVRNAKPGLTRYNKAYWEPEFAAWWEFGDYEDEKGGNPALAPVGYDDDDHCFHLTGFITKTPLAKGGAEPRHVLIREIYEIRKLARIKTDQKGRPMEGVCITFPEKWMAEQEKRPLLDAGARVFYGKGAGTEIAT